MQQQTLQSNPKPRQTPEVLETTQAPIAEQVDDAPQRSNTQRAIWDDAEQLATLRDRANQAGEPLAKVLFQASLQTLGDQQQAAAYRERVTQALMSQADQVTAKPEVDQTHSADDQDLDMSRHERHLKPPHPVSLYEDPLKYKAPNPNSITALSPEDQDQVGMEMEESRDKAILLNEAHNELFRPLMGLAACVTVILLIGMGAYLKGWIGQPQTVNASQDAKQVQPVDE
ncbi:MAG: hypothetical protein ACF8OB_19360 [Phycisphaeraceae bacterium JB051]